MNNKGYSPIILIIGFFIFAVFVGGGYYFYNYYSKNNSQRNAAASTNPVVIPYSENPQYPDISIRNETLPLQTTSQVEVKQDTKIVTTKAQGKIIESPKTEVPKKSVLNISPPPKPTSSDQIINKKVFLVVYNPKSVNKNVIEEYGYRNPQTITNEVISFFNEVTSGRIKYSIVKNQTFDYFPVKTDGFTYTAATYNTCLKSSDKSKDCHTPDTADYLAILKLTEACELANKGEIDELWIWGGPYFGFWESNMAGPGAFFLNSGPTTGSTCQKILPIMGFSYERTVNEAVHNFGHRAESSMKKVFGSWDPKPTHEWNRFTLLNKDQKDLAGCGNIHFAPNSTKDYEYTSKNYVLSHCDDFREYPTIRGNYKKINCEEWGCSELNYYKYWWTHLPQNTGKHTDSDTGKEILNNWLFYVLDFSWVK